MPRGDNRGVIRALKKQERAYRKVLREVVDTPVLAGFAQGLADASELAVAIETGIVSAQSRVLKGLDTGGAELVDEFFIRLSAEHKELFIKKFTSMVSVDVRDLLRSGPIAQALEPRIQDNVNLIRLIAKEHLPKVGEAVKQALKDQPFDRNHLRKYFQSEWGYKDYPLRRIARDQVNKSIGQFNEIRQTQLGIEQYEWLAVGDNRTRPEHQRNSGQTFYWNDPPSDTGHPGDAIQCFPGNVSINPAGLKRSISYRYIGELIEIVLADGGSILTTTPNHPILTQRGWIEAGLLNESDQLIIHLDSRFSTSTVLNPKATNVNLFAEQLHNLLSTGHGSSGTCRSVDLYSNPAGWDEDIDVVLPPSKLRNCFKAMGREIFHDLTFKNSDFIGKSLVELRALNSFIHSPPDQSSFVIRSTRQKLPFLEASIFHADQVGLAGRPRSQAQVLETRNNLISADSQMPSHLLSGHLLFKHFLDSSMMNFPRFKMARISSLGRNWHDGQIYSFESDTGVLLTNGIVVSNCRCVAVPIIPDLIK